MNTDVNEKNRKTNEEERDGNSKQNKLRATIILLCMSFCMTADRLKSGFG